MDAVADFEDMLRLLDEHGARYLIIGGLAFIYHAKPRYTKDMDIWVEPSEANRQRVNRALSEFGSPWLFDPGKSDQIIQIGVEPNRIDLLLKVGDFPFATAWRKRVRDRYVDVLANWIDIGSLLRIKQAIDHPRHQDDARVLGMVVKARRRGAAADRKSQIRRSRGKLGTS